jgi:hypothetical protein
MATIIARLCLMPDAHWRDGTIRPLNSLALNETAQQCRYVMRASMLWGDPNWIPDQVRKTISEIKNGRRPQKHVEEDQQPMFSIT